MIRVMVCVAVLLTAACASAPRDPHAEACLVMGGLMAGGGASYLSDEQWSVLRAMNTTAADSIATTTRRIAPMARA